MSELPVLVFGILLVAFSAHQLGRRRGREEGFHLGQIYALREVATARLKVTEQDAADFLDQLEGHE